MLVGASQGRCDAEREQATGSENVQGLPAQSLCCLLSYGHVSIFLLPPLPACKKGIAPLKRAEMRRWKSKCNLKIA